MPLTPIVLDFETYYDTHYNLTKMLYQEYIGDERFEVIGFSYQELGKETIWVDKYDVERVLAELQLEKRIFIAHNAVFDATILRMRYGIVPAYTICTESMAQALQLADGASLKVLAEFLIAEGFNIPEKGEEVHDAKGKHHADFTEEELSAYANYARKDVYITAKMFQIFMQHYKFPKKELDVINLTMSMMLRPVIELDKERLEKIDTNAKQVLQALLDSVGHTHEELRGRKSFAKLLEDLNVPVPMKTNSKGVLTYAFAKTDQQLLDLQEHPDKRVRDLIDARIGGNSSQLATRTIRFLSLVPYGALPFWLRYYAAHTGRFGGTQKTNLQNLPRTKFITESTPLNTPIITPDGVMFLVKREGDITYATASASI